MIREKHCANCGKRFACNPQYSEAQWARARCCSYRCSGEYKTLSIKQRLLRRREVDRKTGCWLWTGTRTSKNSYGQMQIDGMVRRVHRVAYETFVGPVTNGLWVLHKCDVMHCFNPKHLYLGTCQDNVDDAMARGQHPASPLRKGAA